MTHPPKSGLQVPPDPDHARGLHGPCSPELGGQRRGRAPKVPPLCTRLFLPLGFEERFHHCHCAQIFLVGVDDGLQHGLNTGCWTHCRAISTVPTARCPPTPLPNPRYIGGGGKPRGSISRLSSVSGGPRTSTISPVIGGGGRSLSIGEDFEAVSPTSPGLRRSPSQTKGLHSMDAVFDP